MNINEYWNEVSRVWAYHPEWRYGQAAFNVLYTNFPDLANAIRGTEIDPFNIQDPDIDPRWDAFINYVYSAIPRDS